MSLIIYDGGQPEALQPLSCSYALQDLPVAGISIKERLTQRYEKAIAERPRQSAWQFGIHPSFWPADALLRQLLDHDTPFQLCDQDGSLLAWGGPEGKENDAISLTFNADEESLRLRYPWDILRLCELIVGSIEQDCILGHIRERVSIDGVLELGAGSVLLPGVFIEGKVIIGKNAKVGPNCYIRGASYVGDGCHIGQAVEIKNSMIMADVSAGHLSYIGDSIVGPRSNFGAGTITANFRHDGQQHRSMVVGELLDTGRRKFGAIIGADVHTGIHTAIYPGRKLWPGSSTRPGAVVQRDLHPEA
jgi:acetyltransferase-like isoleucine patch superfamily enzyme